jgi:hypothetical protein
MGENHFAAVPSALYGLVLLAAAIAYWILQQTIIASQGPDSLLKGAIGRDWKGKLSPVLYVCAIVSTFLWSWVAQLIYLAAALIWLVPDRRIERSLRGDGALTTLIRDIDHMPRRMRELIPVQFFSWLALFAMWTQTTAAVTRVHFGATDTVSAAYNEGANWVGVLFAAYNGFAALAAVIIPWLVRRYGMRVSHLINLTLGGIGLFSFLAVRDPRWRDPWPQHS